MKLHATRLAQGEDLKIAITTFAREQSITSGVIVSAVGSLSKATMRMVGAEPHKQDIRTYDGPFEIVSLIGTVASDGKVHLHLSISDGEGKVIGGHLKEGSIVHTTVELAILEDETKTFSREVDPKTGFDELIVTAM